MSRDGSTFRSASFQGRLMQTLDKLSGELHRDVSSVQNNTLVCMEDFDNQIEMINRKKENHNLNQIFLLTLIV